MLFTGDGSVEFFINLPAACVNAAIADHFVMLFWDMSDKAPYELHNRKSLFNISVIFVAVVMEGFIWLCIDIETVFVFPVTAGLYLFTKKNRFWIPFQISAKGVKNHDETGSEVHGLILLKEHA